MPLPVFIELKIVKLNGTASSNIQENFESVFLNIGSCPFPVVDKLSKPTLLLSSAIADKKLIIEKLRQLRRAEHGRVTHQNRRRDLDIAMFARVQVEHELLERALKPRQRPLQHNETSA